MTWWWPFGARLELIPGCMYLMPDGQIVRLVRVSPAVHLTTLEWPDGRTRDCDLGVFRRTAKLVRKAAPPGSLSEA